MLPDAVSRRRAEWQAVVDAGHEVGNHTVTHPCSANYDFSRTNALEDYSLERIAAEIDRASDAIQGLLGVRPTSFAYPCGQSFVGRGSARTSYVPVVARRFAAGRGYGSETSNDPLRCDMGHLDAFTIDGLAAEELVGLVDNGEAAGRWVIMAGHDVGRGRNQTVLVESLTELAERCGRGDVWVAPVSNVAAALSGRREAGSPGLEYHASHSALFTSDSTAATGRRCPTGGGDVPAPKLPNDVITMMADRNVRMHHYLWHQVRNMWLFYDDDTRQQLKALGWAPPRPARRPGPDRRPQILFDNASGEDFLFMHRQMIADVNEVLARVGDPRYPKVTGWNPIPRPGDAHYPVPPAWDSGDADVNEYLREVKSTEYFETSFVAWEQQYTDPSRLRQLSLGALGARLEYTIHNQMHMRWAEEPGEIRPEVDVTAPEDIDPRWDDPAYDWLGDTYSSHVNPIFWKLHGWVDDRIEDWRVAHGLDKIPWTGTWVGGMPEHYHHHSPHALLTALPLTPTLPPDEHDGHIDGMAQVLKVVKSSGKFHRFEPVPEVPELEAVS